MVQKVIVLLFLLQNSWAQPVTVVSNEALFQRAYKSISFILMMASKDQVFLSSLNTKELKIFLDISEEANHINTQNWLESKKIESIMASANNEYGYVKLDNQIQMIKTLPGGAAKLLFSNDRSLFDLNDGKPERTAITGPNREDPIIVNLQMINSSKVQLTLGDAFSMLTHELGHKVFGQNIQSDIDSIAGKLKRFIDTSILTTDIQGARVHVLKFEKSHFFDWAMSVLKSDNQSSFKIYDNEGVYVLLESSAGFEDITDIAFEKLREAFVVGFDQRKINYQYEVFRWFLSDWLRVEQNKSGQFSLGINIQYNELIVPFLRKNSPDAVLKRPFESEFLGLPYAGGLLNHTSTFSYGQGQAAKLVGFREGYIRHVDPTYEVRLKEKKWVGEDLILVYKIRGKKTLNFGHYDIEEMKIWPELLFEFNSNILEIRASTFNSATDEYEFRIPKIKNANAGLLKVVGLEFSAERTNLVQYGSLSKISSSLENQEVIQLQGPEVKVVPKLRDVQAWNGNAWVSILTQNTIPQGSFIRLVFNSTEKMRSLNLNEGIEMQLEVTYFDESESGVRYEVATVRKNIEGVKASVSFDESQMRQEVNGQLLYVDIEIDKNVDLELTRIMRPDPRLDVVSRMRKKDSLTPHHFKALPFRWLLSYKVVTESLSVIDAEFERPMPFIKATTRSPVYRNPIKNVGLNECKSLITK